MTELRNPGVPQGSEVIFLKEPFGGWVSTNAQANAAPDYTASIEGVQGGLAKEQTNQYVTALDICLLAPNCVSYTTWGITDRYGSNTLSDRYPLIYGTSLLWDQDMKAKTAYLAIQKRLQQ